MSQITRTFLPNESIAFKEMLKKFEKSFEEFGFIPHLTPVLSDEELMVRATGMQEIFRVIDTTGKVTGMGLRVDHTVPFAQFVYENKDRLIFPFKRYTAQKVWRPKEDEFKEFTSCDIDTIGRERLSLVHDAEILALIYHAFKNIGLCKEDNKPAFRICINNRKIVNGFLAGIGVEENELANARLALNWYCRHIACIHGNKLCAEEKEIAYNGLKKIFIPKQAQAIFDLLELEGSNEEILYKLSLVSQNRSMRDGIRELMLILEYAEELGVPAEVIQVSPLMVRRMHYYTGITYRTMLVDYPNIDSICHGGRYVIKINGSEDKFPGVGVTIHLTQLFDFLLKYNFVSCKHSALAPVMVSGIGSIQHAMQISSFLRQAGIKVEMFLDIDMPLNEQIEYARKRGFRCFIWTEKEEGELGAEDIVMVQDLRLPSRPEKRMYWGLVHGIKVMLGMH